MNKDLLTPASELISEFSIRWPPKESFENGSWVPKMVSPGLENEVRLNKEGGSVGATARAS